MTVNPMGGGHRPIQLSVLAFALMLQTVVNAQTDEELAEFARKAQDPLGDVKALMTDNTIGFDGGENDDTTYGFQLQPVYSTELFSGWNTIFRGIVPVVGIEPGVVVPPLGPEPSPSTGSTWGVSDTIFQTFFSPQTEGAWKWGVGPQVSIDTASTSRVAGPGWGYGAAAVLFGGVGDVAIGLVGMYHWGEDDFEIASLQPIVFYNFPNHPGLYVGYNNSITYSRKAESGNRWQVPLGLTFGKTLLLGNGDGLDLNIGAYDVTVDVDQGTSWQLKFGVSYFFN